MSKYKHFVHRGMTYVGLYDENRVYYKDEVVTYAGTDVYVCVVPETVPKYQLDSVNDWKILAFIKDVAVETIGFGAEPALMTLEMSDSPGLLTIMFNKPEPEV